MVTSPRNSCTLSPAQAQGSLVLALGEELTLAPPHLGSEPPPQFIEVRLECEEGEDGSGKEGVEVALRPTCPDSKQVRRGAPEP
jgi:hypothetical protein